MLAGLVLGLQTGCFQTPFSTTASISDSGGTAAVVQGTTDSGGRTSGSYDPNATYAQQLVASSGDIAGTSVTFPPGSLSFATTISVESGASLADGSALADLGLALSNAIASSGASVIVRPSENVTLLQPMSLSIPLPAGYGLVGLSLSDDDRLAILAKVFDANGELKSKLIPRKNITSENGNAKFDTMAFGAFQTVVMEQPVTEAAEAKTSEPIANKNGVAVITSSGVVAATEIAAAEQKKPLTFQTFTASFSSSTRKLTIASKLSESILIKSCSLTLRDVSTKAVRFSESGVKDKSTDTVSAQIPLPENVEGNLEAAIVCESKDVRIARSDWTSIGAVAKAGFGFTKFVPSYLASTREVKIEGEMPQSSSAITSCTFKFRNAAIPDAIVYEATKKAGTSTPSPILLPYNISGSIEILATCVTVDKGTASTAWTALGTIAPGANGTVEILPDQETDTSVRVRWTVPPGMSQTTQFKVERATSLSVFDSGTGDVVTVADWFIPESGASGSLIEKTATDLTSGTKYFFRVATRNSENRAVLYYPVVPSGNSSGGVSAGGVGTGGGTAAAGGGTGGGTGNLDTTVPTITEFASVSHLAPGQIHLRTGRAYDNTTTSETLLYKLVYSSSPITNVTDFDATSSNVTRVRDWAAVTNQTIVITSTPTTLKYYTLAVKDAAGNIALHPSLGLILPGQSLPTIDFNSDIALNMKMYGSLINSAATATSFQYKISAGTKPGLDDLIPAPSTTNPITLPASATASFSVAPLLPSGTTLSSGQTYHANLVIYDSAGSEIARLYAPVYARRPMVLYEFENNGLNSGASASWVASGQTSPYPATVPTGFVFSNAKKKSGSFSAAFNGSQFMDVPDLNLRDSAVMTGSAGLTGFTMGGWVHQTSTQTNGTAFFGIDNFLEFGLGGEGSLGRLGIYVAAIATEFSGSTALPANSWHHVVVSGFAGDGTNAGRVDIYLDGVSRASKAVDKFTTRFDSGATALNSSFKIGGRVWSTSDTKFTGFMDDVFFSPWAYSDNAIRQMSLQTN